MFRDNCAVDTYRSTARSGSPYFSPVFSHRGHHARFIRKIMIQTVRAQVTGGTPPAAVPFNAVVAGQGLVANNIQLAPVVSGAGFQPYPATSAAFRSGSLCHSQIDSVIECFHEFIPAVRVAREVGLTYARDHRFGFHGRHRSPSGSGRECCGPVRRCSECRWHPVRNQAPECCRG